MGVAVGVCGCVCERVGVTALVCVGVCGRGCVGKEGSGCGSLDCSSPLSLYGFGCWCGCDCMGVSRCDCGHNCVGEEGSEWVGQP